MTETQYVTPLVRKVAAQHGVDLSKLEGTGIGGRIRKQDVLAVVALRTPAMTAPPRLALVVPSAALIEERRSNWANVQVKVDAYARNPLIDDARQASPANYEAGKSEGPIPTLFVSGDLPAYIASGASPDLLLRLPWQARHAAAVADAVSFARMLERYAGETGVIAAATDFGGHEGNSAYRDRVSNWLSGTGAKGAWNKESTPARKRADDATYKSMYGASDDHKAAQATAKAESAAAKNQFQKDQRERQLRAAGRS